MKQYKRGDKVKVRVVIDVEMVIERTSMDEIDVLLDAENKVLYLDDQDTSVLSRTASQCKII